MPRKKDYPKWFSYYLEPSSPYKPLKPKKTIQEFESSKVIAELTYEDSTTINVEGIVGEGELHLTLCHDYNHDYGCDYSAKLEFVQLTNKPNPLYHAQMERYKKDLIKYEKDYKIYKENLKEWKKLKKKWENEIKAEQEEIDRKTYLRLKKRFEK